MLIDRLCFRDFLVFKGSQEIRFRSERGRNLTLVLAPNNTGKTSIIRALEFLLYGEVRPAFLGRLPNLARVKELGQNETAKSLVEATIRVGASKYTITRQLLFSRAADDDPPARVHEVQLAAIEHRPDTDRRREPGPDLEGTVSRFVPRAMFDFFFFKGEELKAKLLTDDPDRDVLDELKRLLYRSELESVTDVCKKAEQTVGKELARIAEHESEYRSAIAILGDLEDKLAKQREELSRDTRLREHFVAQAKELDGAIANLAAISNPNARQQLESIRKQLEKNREDQRLLEIKRNDVVGSDATSALADLVAPAVRVLLEDMRERRLLPPDLSEGLLVRLLNEHTCICGREIARDSAEEKTIEVLRSGCISEQVSNDLWTLDTLTEPTHGGGFRSKRLTVLTRLEEYQRRLTDLLSAELQLERAKKDLEASVDENVAQRLAAKRLERSQCQAEAQRLEAQISELRSRIAGEDELKRRLEGEINRLGAATSQSPLLKARSQICRDLEKAARGCQKDLEEAILKQLRGTVTSLYDSIVNDGSRAHVDGKSLLPTIERSGVKGLAAGGGQEQAVLLCYLIALGKLRQTINQKLRDHFRITEFTEQAFFMDSVFGQMQPEYQQGIARLLPEHISQLVVLLAGQQWTDHVAEGLKGKITCIYGLELSTPKKIRENEYAFRVGGKSVVLARQLGKTEEAFTTIRKLE